MKTGYPLGRFGRACRAMSVVMTFCLLIPLPIQSQTPQPSLRPGEYGPVYEEPGFHEKGDYLSVNQNIHVNLFGGQLLISASDINIPSIGGFDLFFSRTYSSARLFLPLVNQRRFDSPLGLGWTSHYGILIVTPVSSSIATYEFINNDGSREIFYPHNHLNTLIPFTGESPNQHKVWISSSLKVLRSIDTDEFQLLTPDGLKYKLTRENAFTTPNKYVPTQLEDVHGNHWTIEYEDTSTWYGEHPVVQ